MFNNKLYLNQQHQIFYEAFPNGDRRECTTNPYRFKLIADSDIIIDAACENLWIDRGSDILTSHQLDKICKTLVDPNCKWKLLMMRCGSMYPDEISKLCNALIINTSVLEIDMRYTEFGDVGAECFANMIRQHLPVLQSINLSDNNFTKHGAIQLISAVVSADAPINCIWFNCNDKLSEKDYRDIERYKNRLRRKTKYQNKLLKIDQLMKYTKLHSYLISSILMSNQDAMS